MRGLVPILVGLLLSGAVFSIGSSFGATGKGAVAPGDAFAGACDSDGVSTGYRSGWDAAAGRYAITSVRVSDVSDACDGQSLEVTLVDAAGAQIGTGTLVIREDAETSFDVALTTFAPAETTAAIHVTIGS